MSIARYIYPKIGPRQFGVMLWVACIGTAIAGSYGIVHDQITFSLSEEYFTRFKFLQFDYADFGWPQRIFVAEIGFLATWWVGFLSAWFLARIAVPAWPVRIAVRHCIRGFGIIIGCAILAGMIGFALGSLHSDDYSNWASMTQDFGVTDIRAFVLVGYIHNASYLGGLIGLVVAMIRLRKSTRQSLNSTSLSD